MTNVITLSRTPAGAQVHSAAPSPKPIIAATGRAPLSGVGTVERQAAIENALSMALHFIRQPGDCAANLRAATARANRALTILKQACSEANASEVAA